MSKLTIRVASFTPHPKNTLKGFCSVKIAELHLTINDIGIHTKNGRSWVSLPAKPWIKNGEAVVGDDGKVIYLPTIEFDNTEVRNAFSAAVLKALAEYSPHALRDRGTA